MVVNHSIDPLDRVPISEMRSMIASTKGSVNGPSAREPFDQLMDQTPAAGCVTYEEAEVGGVHGWWCRPDDAGGEAAILYLHGGAYVVGSVRAYQHFVGRLQRGQKWPLGRVG